MTKVRSGRGVAWLTMALTGCTPAAPVDTSGGEGTSSSGGAPTTSTTEDPPAVSTGGIQTVTSATGSTGTDESTGVDACTAAVASLTQTLTAQPRCSLLLHFASDGAVLGWHATCGEAPTEAMYDAQSGLQATSCCVEGGSLLNPDSGSPFIYHAPVMATVPGGLGVVSNHVGAVLFDATIGAEGPGTISRPARWDSPESLGVGIGCPAEAYTFPNPRTYHARTGGPLADAAVDQLAAAIGATALPDALAAGVTVDLVAIVGYEAMYQSTATTHVAVLELRAP